jgi:hypothetical protein
MFNNYVGDVARLIGRNQNIFRVSALKQRTDIQKGSFLLYFNIMVPTEIMELDGKKKVRILKQNDRTVFEQLQFEGDFEKDWRIEEEDFEVDNLTIMNRQVNIVLKMIS